MGTAAEKKSMKGTGSLDIMRSEPPAHLSIFAPRAK